MYASCKEKYWNTVFLLYLMNAATFVSFECQPNEVPNSKSGSLQQSQDPPENQGHSSFVGAEFVIFYPLYFCISMS